MADDEEERLRLENPVLLRVPPTLRPSQDLWSQLFGKTLASAHAVGEALRPVLPKAAGPLTAVSLFYVAASTIDRARVAGQFQIAPDYRTYASNRVGIDNVLREWIARITVPSILVGTAMSMAGAVCKTHGGHLSLTVLTRLPVAAGLLAVPLTMPLSEYTADAVMNWAIRPLLNTYMTPGGAVPWASTPVPGPKPDYVAPNAADLLPREIGTGPEALAGLLGEVDELEQARLKWAMDGNVDTPFPGSELKPSSSGSGADSGTGDALGKSTPFDRSSSESDTEYAVRLDELFRQIHGEASRRAEASRAANANAKQQAPLQ